MRHIHTKLAHAGTEPDATTSGLIPPIHLATTFERSKDGSYPNGYLYSRDGNPTRHLLEETLASLEAGYGSCVFSSGMAACHAVLYALEPGSHIIIPSDVYHGFRRLALEEHAPRGLRVSAVDMQDTSLIADAVTAGTRLIWVETPSNPLLRITDLEKVSTLSKKVGATLVVDSTWTSPVLQRPFEWGADLVVHSLTKYIAGHSDVLGGAVISRTDSDLFKKVEEHQQRIGAVLDPFSCWLTLRGLRTLAVRISAQCDNAAAIADFLNADPRIDKVYFPGLPSHPLHDVARRQMTRFGGMLSIEVKGSEKDAMALASNVEIFRRATSLGGTESLIEHRSSLEGPDSPTSKRLLRLSCGLEYSEDLIGDLQMALAKI